MSSVSAQGGTGSGATTNSNGGSTAAPGTAAAEMPAATAEDEAEGTVLAQADQAQPASGGSRLGGFFQGIADSVKGAAQKIKDSLKRPGEEWAAGPIQNIDEVIIYAKLAKAAYGGEMFPEGWSGKAIEDKESGFRAVVFKGPDGQTVVAFAGTKLLSWADWKANLDNGIAQFKVWDKDVATQYAQALQLADKVVAQAGEDANVVFVGHSLGGGLAALAALGTERDAFTFNGAGLNAQMVANTNRGIDVNDAPKRVSAFRILGKGRVLGDILSSAQAGLLGRAKGIPPNTGLNYRLPLVLKFANHWHGMDAVIAALEEARGE